MSHVYRQPLEEGESYFHPEHGLVEVVELPDADPRGTWVELLEDPDDDHHVNVARRVLSPTEENDVSD